LKTRSAACPAAQTHHFGAPVLLRLFSSNTLPRTPAHRPRAVCHPLPPPPVRQMQGTGAGGARARLTRPKQLHCGFVVGVFHKPLLPQLLSHGVIQRARVDGLGAAALVVPRLLLLGLRHAHSMGGGGRWERNRRGGAPERHVARAALAQSHPKHLQHTTHTAAAVHPVALPSPPAAAAGSSATLAPLRWCPRRQTCWQQGRQPRPARPPPPRPNPPTSHPWLLGGGCASHPAAPTAMINQGRWVRSKLHRWQRLRLI